MTDPSPDDIGCVEINLRWYMKRSEAEHWADLGHDFVQAHKWLIRDLRRLGEDERFPILTSSTLTASEPANALIPVDLRASTVVEANPDEDR